MPRKKQRRSWGSITPVTRNKQIIRWPQNTPEGRKRPSKTLHCTYAEADLELSRLRVRYEKDHPVPTIADAYHLWYRPWLDRRLASGKTKQATLEHYTKCWVNTIGPRWGSTPIDSTPPGLIQEWLLSLNAYNAKIALIVLKKIGDLAMQHEVIEVNKFRTQYDLPSTSTGSKRDITYSLDEADEVFALLKGKSTEAPYILACFGSARTGESLGVRAAEVVSAKSRGMTFAIVPIIRRMGSSGCLPLPDGDLKTPQSERTLIIPPPYGSRLIKIAQKRIAEGIEWLVDSGDGLPYNMGTLGYAWRSEAGAREIPFSNLRNSWRTIAQYEWGIDPDTLEILMGHIIPTTTGRHYLKPSIENLVDAVAKAMVRFRKR